MILPGQRLIDADPDKVRAIRAMAEDGASLNEICRTLHTSGRTIQQYTNGYRGLSFSEGGQLGRAQGRANGQRSSPELRRKLEQARLMVADGVGKKEICRSLNMGWDTLQKHFPDYAGMDTHEAALAAAAARRMNALDRG